MAHNLEMENGEVAFALRGKPAWHNLANRIFSQDEEVTTATMLEEAKLSNWNVRLSPLTDHISESWNDVSLAAKGVLERTGIVVDAGKLVVVRSSAVSVNAVAYGIETPTA